MDRSPTLSRSMTYRLDRLTPSPRVPHAQKPPKQRGNRVRERREGSDQTPTSASRAPAHQPHRRRDRPTINRHPYFRTHLGE
jgi:hypothetical protein